MRRNSEGARLFYKPIGKHQYCELVFKSVKRKFCYLHTFMTNMQTLSPQKYIQTRVRRLPVYKCFASSGWDVARLANIIVMRQHVNGNITAGFYLVDLLCLGVKQTFYFFNESEQSIYDRISPSLMDSLSEIDYNLAHNIVYAGHDFAFDYNILPHRDFSITKFILEEDNEAIPLIEVPTGDHTDGKPHLMAYDETDKAALAKLKKYAGEGNYHFTFEIEKPEMDEEDYEISEDDENDEISLDDIEPGHLNLRNVQDVKMNDLANQQKIRKRDIAERVVIQTEMTMRLLPDEIFDCRPGEEKKWLAEGKELERMSPLPNNTAQWQVEEHVLEAQQILSSAIREQNEQFLVEWISKWATNPLMITFALDTGIAFKMEELTKVARQYAEKLYNHYPCVRLSLAMGYLIEGTADARFGGIYESDHINDAIPGYDSFDMQELIHFWLIRIWVCIESDNLKDALQYYLLLQNIPAVLWYFMPVLMKLNEALLNYLKHAETGK